MAMSENEIFEIRIRKDGKLMMHGLSEELLDVAISVCPEDPWLAKRAAALRRSRKIRQLESEEKREGNVAAETDEGS